MTRWLLYSAIAAALLGGGAFQLGVFDRPVFTFRLSVLMKDQKEDIYAIMALTTTPDIGGNIGRMLHSVKDPLEKDRTAQDVMKDAARRYGAPSDCIAIAVGLYFDDPSAVPDPKWGVGWAVSTSNFEDVEPIRRLVEDRYKGSEAIRAVRLGLKGPGLMGRIPWRTMLTPMIAPMIHWRRAMLQVERDGHEVSAQGRGTGNEASIACEIYVTNEDDTKQYYIDYIVLLGDTTQVWEDCFSSGGNALLSMKKEDDGAAEEEEEAAEMVTAEDEL